MPDLCMLTTTRFGSGRSPWERAGHPDESKSHLRLLAPLLTLFAKWCKNYGYGSQVAVFMDTCSLFQDRPGRPRTEAEAVAFKKGLRCINLIYAHQTVWVWCLSAQYNYLSRGW